jgi:hypothetical protein
VGTATSTEEMLAAISDPATPLDAVRDAIARLPSVAGSPRLWLGVAADVRFSADHRARVVSAFFHRHIPDGTTLGELATQLEQPPWLSEDDVDVVSVMAGKLPVRWSPDETVIVLRPSFDGRPVGAVYLTVRGHLERPTVQAVICRNGGDPDARRARIVDKGFDAALT